MQITFRAPDDLVLVQGTKDAKFGLAVGHRGGRLFFVPRWHFAQRQGSDSQQPIGFHVLAQHAMSGHDGKENSRWGGGKGGGYAIRESVKLANGMLRDHGFGIVEPAVDRWFSV